MAWLTEDIANNLLGNARPKTYADCRQDQWWYSVFYRWWQEGANGKDMYQSVHSCYEDLAGFYGGTVGQDELVYNWVTAPGNVALIDARARQGLRQAVQSGGDVRAAVDQLWYAVEPQMETVYRVFYDDVGNAKEIVRRKGVEDAIEECFPGL